MNRKARLVITLAVLVLAESQFCTPPPPDAGKKGPPQIVYEPGIPVSSRDFEFQRLNLYVKDRISVKDDGVVEPKSGHEFLLVQLQVKCLRLMKMFVRGAAREANILNLANVELTEEAGKIYKCGGYGPDPEDVQMKVSSLLFTEEKMERTVFLLFEVDAAAKGLKLQLPHLPPMDLPI
ncbi:MAG: hypothetical protein AB1696_08070 [Planctomycetota bacterium]